MEIFIGFLGLIILLWFLCKLFQILEVIFLILCKLSQMLKLILCGLGQILKLNKKNGMITIDEIDMMTGREFEYFLRDLFEIKGFKVEMTSSSNDQGADLIVEEINNQKVAIQAKRYKDNVGNKAIQQVVASINYYNCDCAIVITNSYFTKSAHELAQANNVELWNRGRLIDLL